MNRLRCAIYTRKSTEEGLDQDFNSLEAQREACAAYIKSQAGEGWTCLKARYDDGGVSGATMDRPALQRLLADIGSGKIDVIVVYKVDRLTRALSDFAKMVEIFDANKVSFVSVTQQFNTTTSMGRLTLNVLLSFAQFEREVTAERIRDKIAASKKKGMWMGGVVPLGYDVVERKLVINEAEAETVCTLFRLYLKLGNVRLVKEEAGRLGLRTKARKPNKGQRRGGEPFVRGHIYDVLSNPLYIGQIAHKGEHYDGEHPAIVDRETWEQVRQQLQCHAVRRHRGSNTKTGSLLAGRLFDEDGQPLVPSTAYKAKRRYRYYISKSLRENSGDRGTGWRLPAAALESLVLQAFCTFLKDEVRFSRWLGPSGCPPGRLGATLKAAARLASRLEATGPAEQAALLREVVHRVELHHDRVRITIDAGVLRVRIVAGGTSREAGLASEMIPLEIPIRLKRRGVELKMVMCCEDANPSTPDPTLVATVTRARRWYEELRRGEANSVTDLARLHGVDRCEAGRTLPLAFLAPDIVEAILDGRQPLELTATRLKRIGELPPNWSAQRALLGFA